MSSQPNQYDAAMAMWRGEPSAAAIALDQAAAEHYAMLVGEQKQAPRPAFKPTIVGGTDYSEKPDAVATTHP